MTGNHYPEETRQYARKRRLAGASYLTIAHEVSALSGRSTAHRTVRYWCRDIAPFRADKQLWPIRWIKRARELRQEGVSIHRICLIIEIESKRPVHHSVASYWLQKEKEKNARHRRRSQRRSATGGGSRHRESGGQCQGDPAGGAGGL